MMKNLLLSLMILTSCGVSTNGREEINNPYQTSAYFCVDTSDSLIEYNSEIIEKVWLYDDQMLVIDFVDDDYRSDKPIIYYKDYIAFYWLRY